MSNSKEKQDGLPEMYLSPSWHGGQGHEAFSTSSDTEPNAWEDTDSESWIALVPQDTLGSAPCTASSLCQREEIEGGSSLDMPVGGTSQERETEYDSEETQTMQAAVSQAEERGSKTLPSRGRNHIPRQRGETPGSDCPPVAGIAAFVRRFGQPLNLDTETPIARSGELIFSPGGDQGFIVPGGVHAYYGSASDIENLEWADSGELALVPVRDAVEGADAEPSQVPALDNSVGDLERNSPVGLSTPDAEVDLPVTSGRTLVSKKPQKGIRPPAVGQSEEVIVQASRKDLGSTDGEESEEESRKIMPQEAAAAVSNSTEVQLGSLGSQSENTDSVSTVLDMRRGEVQGCERDCVSNTAMPTPALGGEAPLIQTIPKPSFVVGGLISPRGRRRQFQDTVRGRMQDVKASLKVGSDNTDEPVDRQHYLNQLPLRPSMISATEPEVSLASLISMESTNPPDSSDRVTSPSVLSVSSVASSKRMEWDSGADVGYLGSNIHVTPAASLSTLERIALGSYASVLRTEPEGTTQAKEKQRGSKKGGKSATIKGADKGATSKQLVGEPSSSSPLHSARTHHNRGDKVYLSSSEENLSGKLSSPAQSPRRRLRRRALPGSPREGDASLRRSNLAMHFLDRRLRETIREHHREGKSCSLVELAMPAVGSGQCQRSSSQQSLPSVATSQASSGGSVVAEKDLPGVPSSASWNKKGDQLVTNTSTSTSTLVQSMSPLPVGSTLASTTTSTVTPGSLQHQSAEKEGHKSMTGDSRCSSMSSLAIHAKEYLQYRRGRPSWTSSGNDVSSRSEVSSPGWLPSHTDTDSVTSRPFSTDEPGDLKARKNSENAKNHEYMVRKDSSSDLESREVRVTSSSTSPGHLADSQNGGADSTESTLESQVSLQSFNNALHALSVKLQEHIQALLDNGSLRKEQDYNKLQDYVRFVGLPSVTEEECRLRQGVAGVITRMFGEIAFDPAHLTTDTSNTFTSETSDSHAGDPRLPTPGTCEELDVPLPWPDDGSTRDEGEYAGREQEQQGDGGRGEEQVCTKEQEQQGDGKEQEKIVVEEHRCTTPGGTVVVVPYRPPSASRTYFMAVSHEWEAGLVEGEHVPVPGAVADAGLPRGQAEGEQEEGATPPPPVTPRYSRVPSASVSSNEWDSEKLVSVEGVTLREAEHKTLPSLPSLSPDHYLLPRSHGSGTQSDSSPSHSNHSFLHAWPAKELSGSQWWTGDGRRERLYTDKRGGLHVAHQPPDYTDDHDDSHPSESLSDHDHRHRHHSGEGGRLPARPWTSSGSESAYETIRERHRHVDEALASSFEFYSTSPRDARLLGYVSSEGQEGEEAERQAAEAPMPPLSPARSDSATQSRSLSCPWQQQQQQHRHTEAHNNSTLSSHTDAQDVSSQISFIQLQKQKYVRKIQRHIGTLAKLEKALLDQLGDSLASEGAFKQRLAEGNHSGTGSDTNGNIRTHDLLGHTDTTTSSIMSSEDSRRGAKNKKRAPYCPEKVSRSSHALGQGSLSSPGDGKAEDVRLSHAPSGTGHSYTSSPRVNISQISSDMNSSRASTMRQVEEEVRKLASAEERSRRMVLQPRASSSTKGSRSGGRRMHKADTWREDRAQSGLSGQSEQSSAPEMSVSGRRRPRSAVDASGAGGGSSSKAQSTLGLFISEESSSELPASKSPPISRQGDGRESKEKKQGGSVVFGTGRVLTLKSPVTPGVGVSGEAAGPLNVIPSKDFGQMFPSSECIAQGSERKGESVGVQTGDSLLYPRKSSRKRDTRISVSTSERESTCESSRNKKAWSKAKESSEINEDTDGTKNHIRKPSNGRASDKTKPSSNRKHYVEKIHKLQKVSKEKETMKGIKRNKEPKSKSYEQSHSPSKKLGAKASRKETGKERDKSVPARQHKAAAKPDKETAGSRNRGAPLKAKCDGLKSCESSSRPRSDSEDRTLSNPSSLSESLESGSLESSELGGPSSGKAESVQSEARRRHSHDGDSSSTLCSEEADRHQLDQTSHISDNFSQGRHTPPGEQASHRGGQTSSEEAVQGLKGGAQEALTPEAPGWMLISPPMPKVKPRQKTQSSKSLTTTIKPAQRKREENLKNQTNLMHHGTQKEVNPPIASQGSHSARLGHLAMSGTLKVAWQEDTQVIIEQRKPVGYEIKLSNQENTYPKSKLLGYTTTTTVTHATKKAMTLQEALARARPDYLREAGDRSSLIRLKREMRCAVQTQNHHVLAQLPPNLQTPSTLQRFLYKPDLAPLFSYKDIRQQNQRLYSLLPESQAPGVRQHDAAVHRTNRLLANLYSQRLRRKAIQGRVSHAHKEVVTPVVHRVLQQ